MLLPQDALGEDEEDEEADEDELIEEDEDDEGDNDYEMDYFDNGEEDDFDNLGGGGGGDDGAFEAVLVSSFSLGTDDAALRDRRWWYHGLARLLLTLQLALAKHSHDSARSRDPRAIVVRRRTRKLALYENHPHRAFACYAAATGHFSGTRSRMAALSPALASADSTLPSSSPDIVIPASHWSGTPSVSPSKRRKGKGRAEDRRESVLSERDANEGVLVDVQSASGFTRASRPILAIEAR